MNKYNEKDASIITCAQKITAGKSGLFGLLLIIDVEISLDTQNYLTFKVTSNNGSLATKSMLVYVNKKAHPENIKILEPRHTNNTTSDFSKTAQLLKHFKNHFVCSPCSTPTQITFVKVAKFVV